MIKEISEKWNAPKKENARPAPKSGAGRFFYLLWNYFFHLIGINILFFATCLPIVTIPASACALNRYLIKMVRDGFGFSVSDYFREWKNELLRSIPAGVFVGLLLVYGSYLLSIANQISSGMSGVRFVGFLFLNIALLYGAYLFFIIAVLEISLANAFRNALFLMLLEWKRSLLLLLIENAVLVAIIAYFPFSIMALVILPSWNQMMVCCLLNGPLQERILDPYGNK
ncbi:MAG: DUF624 domain-containing protein [Lachnospiraceae bacterium]|nr:DUF624 domain-containing protein [Lachnospiraceae bacterium]